MPIIRDLATVLVIIRSLRTEAHRQIVGGHSTGAVLDYLLDEIDQLAEALADSGGSPIDRGPDIAH
jgi:hypothetical protein